MTIESQAVEVKIRRVGATAIDSIGATLDEAFTSSDAISGWIFPDKADRERVHPGFMRLFAELGVAEGEVYATEDFNGVAVWFPVDPSADSHSASDFVARVAQHCGPHADRFRALDHTMGQHHPTSEPH